MVQDYADRFRPRLALVFPCAVHHGPEHRAVSNHGFHAHLCDRVLTGKPYTVVGHAGRPCGTVCTPMILPRSARWRPRDPGAGSFRTAPALLGVSDPAEAVGPGIRGEDPVASTTRRSENLKLLLMPTHKFADRGGRRLRASLHRVQPFDCNRGGFSQGPREPVDAFVQTLDSAHEPVRAQCRLPVVVDGAQMRCKMRLAVSQVSIDILGNEAGIGEGPSTTLEEVVRQHSFQRIPDKGDQSPCGIADQSGIALPQQPALRLEVPADQLIGTDLVVVERLWRRVGAPGLAIVGRDLEPAREDWAAGAARRFRHMMKQQARWLYFLRGQAGQRPQCACKSPAKRLWFEGLGFPDRSGRAISGIRGGR